tara:strand:+ start:3512 stop:3697 length:186 start_codon:yes stop_codon:yes gene_type:complete
MKAHYKSRGLGDSIEKFTKATGIKKVVDTVSKATGKDCGCGKRRDFLNNPDLLVNKVLYKK